MNPELKFILAASFGTICQEVLYWWDLRNSLTEEKSQVILSSRYYWILVTLMIVVSGIGTYILCYEDGITRLQIPMILGAAFPIIFKKAVNAASGRDLGGGDLSKKARLSDVAKSYFR